MDQIPNNSGVTYGLGLRNYAVDELGPASDDMVAEAQEIGNVDNVNLAAIHIYSIMCDTCYVGVCQQVAMHGGCR